MVSIVRGEGRLVDNKAPAPKGQRAKAQEDTMDTLFRSLRRPPKDNASNRRAFAKILAGFPWLWQVANHWAHDSSASDWVRVTISQMCDVFHFFLLSPAGEIGFREDFDSEPIPIQAVWLYQEDESSSRCMEVTSACKEHLHVSVALQRALLPQVRYFAVAVMMKHNTNGHELLIFDWQDPRCMSTALELIEVEARQRLHPD